MSPAICLPSPTILHHIAGPLQDWQFIVPILAMQYLTILDAEEFMFRDGRRIGWINIEAPIQSEVRNSLDQPVEYEAVYYPLDAAIMPRL